MPSKRIKAFLIHLSFSLCLISGVSLGVIQWFYPGVFKDLLEISSVIKVLIPVDIIIGPILTFLIYKQGKKGLIFDLIIISLFQVAALSYGMFIVYSQRPGYMIYYFDSFYLLPASIQRQINDDKYKINTFDRPFLIESRLSGSGIEKMKFVQERNNKKLLAQTDSSSFIPFKLEKRSIAKAINPKSLDLSNTSNEIKSLLNSKDLLIYPVIALGLEKFVILDASTSEIIQTLDTQRL